MGFCITLNIRHNSAGYKKKTEINLLIQNKMKIDYCHWGRLYILKMCKHGSFYDSKHNKYKFEISQDKLYNENYDQWIIIILLLLFIILQLTIYNFIQDIYCFTPFF